MTVVTRNRHTDRLSHLPYAVQSHVLSFLPTREAIQTSVLSKQWQKTYYSLPEYEFGQFDHPIRESDECREDFVYCVDNTLANHDQTDIKRFSIFVSVDDDECVTNCDISNWIIQLVEHNIQNLTLWIDSKRPIGLPTDLFTCRSLIRLQLMEVRLRVPEGIQFPMLKSLLLEGIRFEDRNVSDDDETEYIDDEIGDEIGNKLFSATSCPALENLEIFHCDSLGSLATVNPSLKYLKLTTRNHNKFDLCTPTLQELVYRGVGIDISKETLSSLRVATIEIAASFEYPCHDASTILLGLGNVETLTLESSFIELLSWDPKFASNGPTLSSVLKHLNLEVLPIKNQVHAVKFLTSSFPLLRTLHMHSKFIPPDAKFDEELRPDSKLHIKDMSTISKLRTVELKAFQGRDSEVELISYLLATSIVLEKINISYTKEMSSNDKTRAVDLALSGLHRVSPHVVLSIC